MSTPSGCKDIRIKKFNLVGLTTDKMFYKKKVIVAKKFSLKSKQGLKREMYLLWADTTARQSPRTNNNLILMKKYHS